MKDSLDENQRTQDQSSKDAPASLPPVGTSEPHSSCPPGGRPDSRIQGGSIRLFRVAGIDVFLHWSWFFFAVLRLQSYDSDDAFGFAHYDLQVWYAVEYLALFGIVLLHEFGHALACRSVGGIANRIVLWPLGGLAFVDPPPRPGAVLWSIAAGPLVNVLLLLPTIGFWILCRAAGCQDTAPDLCRFAASLAWINGYLLLFNMLPVYPLDGGQILQALLWFVMGRARSLLVATAIGLLTGLGLLIFAIVEGSLVWGIMAGLGVFFSLVGFQSARALIRMLDAPRRKEAACPSCGAAPPIGDFWVCLRCFARFDVFAAGGKCPNCSTPLAAVLCPQCGRGRPYVEWSTEVIPPPLDRECQPVTAQASPGPHQPMGAVRPVTVAQRLVWGTIFAAFALALCGLPSAEKQPLGLIVWTVGGAILGATSAGAMTRAWRNGQARKKLRGKWCLVEVDGQNIMDGEDQPRLLILKGLAYEERVGDQRDVRGACWTDALAEPPAISFTPKTGPDAGKPRQGIYRLEGKMLTLCVAYPLHPRPTAFLVQPNVQQMRVYRRGGKPLTEKSSLPSDDVKIQLYPEQKVLKKLVWICVGLFCILVAIILVVVITNPTAAKEAKDFLEKLKQNPPKLVE
jgi:uncharacterized protein (TIGR03067 family)